MSDFVNAPQQQQTPQQAKQQQQQLKLSPALSAAEARVLFLKDEVARLLAAEGFSVRLDSKEPREPVPLGVTVRAERGMVYVETDQRPSDPRARELFKLVPQATEGEPRFILTRYQFPNWGGIDVEPDYYASSLVPVSLAGGLPAELKSGLNKAFNRNN